MKAWHFTNGKLRNGDPIPEPGVKLVHDGELVMCGSGFHASKRAIDALAYAPGHHVHRVILSGKIIHDNDKSVASERTIVWSMDAENVLRRFARLCALDVIHLWDAPEIVIRYLRTGDESIREAAGGAAWGATRAAAREAAWDAVWAASAAARDAAWAAAGDAARDAAWAAAGDAAEAAQNKRLHRMLSESHTEKGKE